MEKGAYQATLLRQKLAARGIAATVTIVGATVHLVGTVSRRGMRELAEQIVSKLAPTCSIENDLVVVGSPRPAETEPPTSDRLAAREALWHTGGGIAEEARDLLAATEEAVGSQVGEEPTGEPIVPPTDPVTQRVPGGLEILGGFAHTSLDEVAEEAHEVEGEHVRGDEEIVADVQRELREDAFTTDLDLQVHVADGVVFLRGTVHSLDEVEGAEEVAGRVPGVVEVRERLRLAS